MQPLYLMHAVILYKPQVLLVVASSFGTTLVSIGFMINDKLPPDWSCVFLGRLYKTDCRQGSIHLLLNHIFKAAESDIFFKTKTSVK